MKTVFVIPSAENLAVILSLHGHTHTHAQTNDCNPRSRMRRSRVYYIVICMHTCYYGFRYQSIDLYRVITKTIT